jgi:hypothetical protein
MPAQRLDELTRGHDVNALERGRVVDLLRPRDRVFLETETRAG